MDRLTPTLRPEGKPAGTQRWTDLFFLHWPVPVEVLRPLVPARLAIDTWDGTAWVGLVPFLMEDVRPTRWWPRFAGFRFYETNLRTYVHVDGADPGVWFFSLEAASWLAVQAARIGWGLPYHYARMTGAREDDRFEYTSVRRKGEARLDFAARVGERLGPSEPETLEFFLFERYLLHVQRGETLRTGRVHHPPYDVHRAEVERCTETLTRAAGLDLTGPPTLAHFAPGFQVDIHPLRVRTRRSP